MSIGDDYNAAVQAGNWPLANYLARGLAANAGIDVNANTIEAAPQVFQEQGANVGLPTLPSLPSLGSIGSFIGQTLGNGLALDTFGGAPSNFHTDPNTGAVTSGTGQAGAAIGGAVGNAASIFSDPGRLGAIIVGALFIAAGLFGLAGGRPEHVIALTQKAAEAG